MLSPCTLVSLHIHALFPSYDTANPQKRLSSIFCDSGGCGPEFSRHRISFSLPTSSLRSLWQRCLLQRSKVRLATRKLIYHPYTHVPGGSMLCSD